MMCLILILFPVGIVHGLQSLSVSDYANKKSKLCGRDSMTIDPLNIECYMVWDRGGDERNINAISNGAGTDEGVGKVVYHCKRTRSLIPEFKNKTMTELLEALAHKTTGAALEDFFEGWRKGVITKLGDLGPNGWLSAGKVQPETVTKEDKTYRKGFHTGTTYSLEKRLDMVKTNPTLRNRAKMKDTKHHDGTSRQIVRIYDQDVDATRFEEGGESATLHNRSLDDGNSTVMGGQQRSAYEETAKLLFGEANKKDVLKASDMPSLVPTPRVDPLAHPPNGKKDIVSDSDSIMSESSEDDTRRPLPKAPGVASASQKIAKPKRQTKREDVSKLLHAAQDSTDNAIVFMAKYVESNVVKDFNEVKATSMAAGLKDKAVRLEKVFEYDGVMDVVSKVVSYRPPCRLS